MTDPKKINIFDSTFLLDPEKHPVKTRLIRKIRNGWGNFVLIESRITEYSPSGTAVLLSNIPDLTESPVSECWCDIIEASRSVFDIIEVSEEEKAKEPSLWPTQSPPVSGTALPNGMTLHFINPFKSASGDGTSEDNGLL